MPVLSPNLVTDRLTIHAQDHDCPYAERLLASTHRDLGAHSYILAALVDELDELHEESACPPTHGKNNSPTREWADWVHATKR